MVRSSRNELRLLFGIAPTARGPRVLLRFLPRLTLTGLGPAFLLASPNCFLPLIQASSSGRGWSPLSSVELPLSLPTFSCLLVHRTLSTRSPRVCLRPLE
jgi:hypothetical protein